jgi:glycosyl transferase family 87
MRIVLAAALLAVAGAYVALGAQTPWDFETYYYAALALRSHLNPYSVGALSQVAGRVIDLPFLYPPVTLALFLPFTFLSVTAAASLWLAVKVLLLVPLVWIWRWHFLTRTDPSVLLATTLFGFNLALLWDLRTGNVAVVEAVLIWGAFSVYLRGHDSLSAYLISLASVFKQIPVVLLGALALPPTLPRRRWLLLASAVGVLALAVTLPLPLAAEWRRALSAVAAAPRLTGDINPSALGVADWVAARFEMPASSAPLVALTIYLVYCAMVLVSSLGSVLRMRESGSREEQIVLVVLLWLLLSPRVMVYSYIMAIVPVLYVIESRVRSRVWRNIAVGAVLLQGLIRLLPGHPPAFLAPVSFLILIAAWVLLLRQARVPLSSPEPARIETA